MWKALGNEREACFCFHKQLQRFHPTACLGGGWLECESFSHSTLSGFHLLCWCGWFRLRSVDSLCFLWHNSDCAQEWLSQLHLARQVFELLSVFPRHIRLFASDLHWKISTRLWKWHNINMSCLWVTLQLKIVIQLAIIINVPCTTLTSAAYSISGLKHFFHEAIWYKKSKQWFRNRLFNLLMFHTFNHFSF